MTKRAAVLLPSQLRHLLRVTEATSRYPERDVLILWLGFSCGLRVTEMRGKTRHFRPGKDSAFAAGELGA